MDTIEAVRLHEHGDPDVLVTEDVALGPPGADEVRVRHRAIGVNFIDTYHRTGLYPTELPATPGVEASGVVEAVGSDVDDLSEGDRVAYLTGSPGTYAEARNVPRDRIVVVPDGIALEQAATLMVRGMTTEYLLHRTFSVGPETRVLIHAAAGGMGSMLGRWASALGAPCIIGTVSTDEKAELARRHGYSDVIRYDREDVVERVREITDGAMVHVVYDGVGESSFDASLASLKRRGMMVLFGQSSGPVPPFDIGRLARSGSLFLTRPSLFDYVAERDELEASATRVFEAVARGDLEVYVGQRYPLSDAAEAHRDLEARKTTGATLLVPS